MLKTQKRNKVQAYLSRSVELYSSALLQYENENIIISQKYKTEYLIGEIC